MELSEETPQRQCQYNIMETFIRHVTAVTLNEAEDNFPSP